MTTSEEREAGNKAVKDWPEVLDGFEGSSIDRAVELLRRGEVVAFPTETVYGLGADALNPYAVARIFEAKKRPAFDPLIVHISRRDWLDDIAAEVPPLLKLLTERFWPGPLTVIVPKRRIVPDIVTAGLSTVAVRMPSHPVAGTLLDRFGGPLAAPSANPFGYLSPTRAKHVARMFKGAIPLVLDGGDSDFGIESTIVAVSGGLVQVRRHGAVSMEDILATVPAIERPGTEASGTVEAPGELPFHYAPHRPLRIVRSPEEIDVPESSFLAFTTPPKTPVSKHVCVLSGNGNLREAASRFFSCLHELDRDDVSVIFAEQIPEVGLGKAMMERLKKAAKKPRSIAR